MEDTTEENICFDMHRIVHLDMKGAPPKISYLEKLLPTLRAWGATGVLIEWEDTFPYDGELSDLRAGAAYSLDEAARILQLARENHLLVIQLVQCLGHLEFVLKLPGRRDLREVPELPSSMCPSHPAALPLVRAALAQALRLQPDARYLHIGADEVWHMGACEACEARARGPHGAGALLLEHVAAVAGSLRAAHPRVTPIMWDDMLRRLPLHTLQAYSLGALVQPMVWHYNAADSFQLAPELWDKYARLFPDVWIASAFKGASGSCQVVPRVEQHVSNQLGWRREARRVAGRFRSLVGVALTGWARYDHYAALCEVLPAGLPSLASCLAAWEARADLATFPEINARAARMLGCEAGELHAGWRATYPGWELAAPLHSFVLLRESCRNLLHGDTVQTWLNPWQVERGFTNPMHTRGILASVEQLLSELEVVEARLSDELDAVLSSGRGEWVGCYVAPLRSQLTRLGDTVRRQLALPRGTTAGGRHGGESDSSIK